MRPERALPVMHFCVLIWGFTAILGKLITLDALPLVWWRTAIVVSTLLLFPKIWRGIWAIPRRLLGVYAVIGALVTIHWLTFYASIKLANASVAATCMALTPTFVAVLEPLVERRKPSILEIFLSIATIPGIALVVGGVPIHYHFGIAVGAFSAFLVAIFAMLNKRHAHKADALVVTTVELGVGNLLLLPFLLGGSGISLPTAHDAGLLLLLGWGCTLVPFTLSLMALRHLSTFTSQLTVNLEPVYAIIFAAFLLDERRELSPPFYLGVAVVLGVVMLTPLLEKRRGELDSQPAP